MAFIMVYITNESEAEAQRISHILLEKKLIACANLFPIQSAYWWQGGIQQESEWVCLVKTMPEYWDNLRDEVLRQHRYTTPCILKIAVEANFAYEDWIRGCLMLDTGC